MNCEWCEFDEDETGYWLVQMCEECAHAWNEYQDAQLLENQELIQFRKECEEE